MTRLWKVKNVIAIQGFSSPDSDTDTLILWEVATWMLERPLSSELASSLA